jgi:hypothetical protein
MLEIFDILNSTLYSFNPQGGLVWDIAFEPLPLVMLSHAAKTGGNVLGVRPEEGNSYSKSSQFIANELRLRNI